MIERGTSWFLLTIRGVRYTIYFMTYFCFVSYLSTQCLE